MNQFKEKINQIIRPVIPFIQKLIEDLILILMPLKVLLVKYLYQFKSFIRQGLVQKYGEEKVQNLIAKKEKVNTSIRHQSHRILDFIEGKFDKKNPVYPIITIMWKLYITVIAFVIIYFFIVANNFLYLTGSITSVEDLQNPKVSQASELYTSDGVLFGKFFSENRMPIREFEEISPNLTDALLSTEDSRYFKHSGIDLLALLGVAKGVISGNNDRGGGSTISQQLAKNLFNTRAPESKGHLGKIKCIRLLNSKLKEWLTAVMLEQNYTKEEIMVMYLNTVDFGSNAFGLRVAAKTYFDKKPDQLNVQESAVLVGIQKATTTYNPKLHYDNSIKRRNTVLGQMLKYDKITASEFDSIKKLPIDLKHYKVETPYEGSANYFKNAVVHFLKDWVKENNKDLYRDGLKIYTTIDSRMQAYAELALKEKMKFNQKRFKGYWGDKNPWVDADGVEIPGFIDTIAKRTYHYLSLHKKFKGDTLAIQREMNVPRKMTLYNWEGEPIVMALSPMDSIRYYKKLLQAGMMSMDPYTGHVKAWVGGLDYQYFKYDHVKQGRRQPGSTFKPIVYTAALDDTFQITPCDKIVDRPFYLKYRENQEDKSWRPHNADGRCSGNNYTLRKAIAKSVNTVAAHLTMKMGKLMADEKNKKINKYWSQDQYDMEQGAGNIIKYARKMGIQSPMEPIPALCLGAYDVNLYEMVAAYSIFLNNGIYTEPMIVTRIEDRFGKLLYEFQPKSRKAIEKETAFLMTYMLRGGIEEGGGTSKGLFNYKLFPNFKCQMAGKTGTTSNYSDAWYIGMSNNLVSGVWVGGDDRSIHFRGHIGEGSQVALPVFGRYMEMVFEDEKLPYKPGPFPKPSMPIEKVWEDCSKWRDPRIPKQDPNSPHKSRSDSTGEAILPDEIQVQDSI